MSKLVDLFGDDDRVDPRQLRDDLADDIESTAGWREGIAAEYPGDTRNQDAVKILRALAVKVRELPSDNDGLQALLRLLLGPKVATVCEALHEKMREQGFSDAADDAESFVSSVVREIESDT